MNIFRKTKFSSLIEASKNPKNCKKLTLRFYDENLKNKGEIFSEFINLEVLEMQADPSIYHLDDFEFPAEIGNLKKLKKVWFLNFPLKTFPEWISKLKSLQYLMVRGNDIEIIPDSISQLEKLKTLRIENCPLSKIPKTLHQMQNLQVLGLSDTKLTDLNPNLFPKHLKEINFSGTGIYNKEDLEYLKTKMAKTKIYP
ncbi:leucine-rich repeat domain-containing protein [Flavobacterium sp. HJSW_4]